MHALTPSRWLIVSAFVVVTVYGCWPNEARAHDQLSPKQREILAAKLAYKTFKL
jgi:hypothetical protein